VPVDHLAQVLNNASLDEGLPQYTLRRSLCRADDLMELRAFTGVTRSPIVSTDSTKEALRLDLVSLRML
jgi:hypothetical protein